MANQPHPQPPPQQPRPQPPPPPPPAPPPKPEEDAAALPKDFKLAEPGSRDYVAGQPIDEEELRKTQEAARKRIEEARSKK
jgi:colicin import membrane protein